MTSDVDLLLRWKDGDTDACSELIERHFSSIYDFFRAKVDAEASDLVQRTFVGCLESVERLGPDTNFRAYLFGIARKQLLTFFRRKRVHGNVFDPGKRSIADFHHESGTTPTKILFQRDEQRVLLAALRRVPVDFQIAVELYYWENMAVADIAAVLEIPKGTVMSRLGRARKMLREHMSDLADQPIIDATMDNLERWAKSVREVLGEDRPDKPPPPPGKQD